MFRIAVTAIVPGQSPVNATDQSLSTPLYFKITIQKLSTLELFLVIYVWDICIWWSINIYHFNRCVILAHVHIQVELLCWPTAPIFASPFLWTLLSLHSTILTNGIDKIFIWMSPYTYICLPLYCFYSNLWHNIQ